MCGDVWGEYREIFVGRVRGSRAVKFSCCLFDRFGAVLGCQHGAFLESKIDQHATCEFLIFIDFLFAFKAFLRLGGSYVGSISVLFSHRFLH